MEPLPMAPTACSLDDGELREQLVRYRMAGHDSEVLEWGKRRRVIRVAPSVPESLVARLVDVERACCPFFELSWDARSRRLTIAVSAADHEPALDAIGDALGVAGGP